MVEKSCLGAEIWPNEDVCKKLCLQEQILSQNVVGNSKQLIPPSIFRFALKQKFSKFLNLWQKIERIYFGAKNCSLKMRRNIKPI